MVPAKSLSLQGLEAKSSKIKDLVAEIHEPVWIECAGNGRREARLDMTDKEKVPRENCP
jgi:hypothetical protein